MKKLFLLDGMALIYRAHFALSKTPRFTPRETIKPCFPGSTCSQEISVSGESTEISIARPSISDAVIGAKRGSSSAAAIAQ